MSRKVIPVTNHNAKVKACLPCINSLQPLNTFDLIFKDENSTFSLGDALTSLSIVLEQVLEYMDSRDLENIKSIHSEWKMYAEKILKRRMWPAWVGHCRFNRRFSISDGFTYMEPVAGLLFYNEAILRLSDQICIHRSSDHILMPFNRYVKEDIMVNNVNYLSIGCVVTCNGSCEENHCGRGSKSMFQCILFPKIPNIKITLRAISTEIFNDTTLCKPNEIIRCALVFTRTYDIQKLDEIRELLLNGQSQDCVPVGGGIVHSAKISLNDYQFQSKPVSNKVFSIIFTQEKGVQTEFEAYSHIFSPCTDNLNKSLIKFKDQMILRTHGIVARFACSQNLGHEKETKLISKYFPNYHYTSIEVGGELGWSAASESIASLNSDVLEDTSPPPTKQPCIDKKKKHFFLHCFTTILVVLTWGPKINRS